MKIQKKNKKQLTPLRNESATFSAVEAKESSSGESDAFT